MSVRGSSGSPRACSGLMYSGVPRMWPVAVEPAVASGPNCLAIPKSMSRTMPRASRMMFAVLRSRWMTPMLWMAWSPAATWRHTSKASVGSSRPRAWTRFLRSVPSISSIEM